MELKTAVFIFVVASISYFVFEFEAEIELEHAREAVEARQHFEKAISGK